MTLKRDKSIVRHSVRIMPGNDDDSTELNRSLRGLKERKMTPDIITKTPELTQSKFMRQKTAPEGGNSSRKNSR